VNDIQIGKSFVLKSGSPNCYYHLTKDGRLFAKWAGGPFQKRTGKKTSGWLLECSVMRCICSDRDQVPDGESCILRNEVYLEDIKYVVDPGPPPVYVMRKAPGRKKAHLRRPGDEQSGPNWNGLLAN
jgi:hypothetical protein